MQPKLALNIYPKDLITVGAKQYVVVAWFLFGHADKPRNTFCWEEWHLHDRHGKLVVLQFFPFLSAKQRLVLYERQEEVQSTHLNKRQTLPDQLEQGVVSLVAHLSVEDHDAYPTEIPIYKWHGVRKIYHIREGLFLFGHFIQLKTLYKRNVEIRLQYNIDRLRYVRPKPLQANAKSWNDIVTRNLDITDTSMQVEFLESTQDLQSTFSHSSATWASDIFGSREGQAGKIQEITNWIWQVFQKGVLPTVSFFLMIFFIFEVDLQRRDLLGLFSLLGIFLGWLSYYESTRH